MLRPLCRTSEEKLCELLAAWFRKGRNAHPRDLVKVTSRVYPQNLDCNMAALVLALPDVSIPTAV